MRRVAAIILSSAIFTINVCEAKMVKGYSTTEEELIIVWEAWCVVILLLTLIISIERM